MNSADLTDAEVALEELLREIVDHVYRESRKLPSREAQALLLALVAERLVGSIVHERRLEVTKAAVLRGLLEDKCA